MNDKTTHVAISGPIGVGKTTTMIKIGTKYGGLLVPEMYSSNPYKDFFYKQGITGEQRAMGIAACEIWYTLADAYRDSLLSKGGYSDKPPYLNYVFLEMVQGILGNEWTRKCESMMMGIRGQLKRDGVIKDPDLHIVCKAEIPTILGRVAYRGRPHEKGLGHEFYKAYFSLEPSFRKREIGNVQTLEFDTTEIDLHTPRGQQHLFEVLNDFCGNNGILLEGKGAIFEPDGSLFHREQESEMSVQRGEHLIPIHLFELYDGLVERSGKKLVLDHWVEEMIEGTRFQYGENVENREGKIY